ncbi:Oil body-associated protein 1B [Cladobotryum mycophilum]|uniref:Oil body-associated protein 1B n=1 Tax=Cladobotryum mycophilum TaxID=491253 RepID=A0ABR0SC25_9HYPO
MAQRSDQSESTTREPPGKPLSTENKVLTTGASMIQDFAPIKNVCAHLNAFHAYADDPSRHVETNHYCAHLNDDVRQCLLYDSHEPNARLIGIEYMITPYLYESLLPEERRLWHSHVYEVKSGMLIMPKGSAAVPSAAWEEAEKREME